jgi:Ca-activated chloride channel homolog
MWLRRVFVPPIVVVVFVTSSVFGTGYAEMQSPVGQSSSQRSGVTLTVLVTDGQNRPVSDLSEDDFQVVEDGVPQITSFFSNQEAPINYILAMDISGSLKDRIGEIAEAGRLIIKSNKRDDETFLIAFRGEAEAVVPKFTSDTAELLEGLNGIAKWAGGRTALLDAIYLSLDPIADHKKTQPDAGRRYGIILVTDAYDNASYYLDSEVFKRLRKEGVQVFAISLNKYPGKKENPVQWDKRAKATTLMSRIAKETGGYAFFPQSFSDLQNVAKDITRYLRTQYLIGYDPPAKPAKQSYRKVTIKLASKPGHEKYTAHVREGYELSRN